MTSQVPSRSDVDYESEFRRVRRLALADAWDEGAKAMANAVAAERTVTYIAPHNPYREGQW